MRIAASFITLLLAFGLALTLAASLAPPSIPNTPAGRTFAAWLAAFDARDRAKLLRFYKVHNPSHLDWADTDIRLARTSGGFDVRKIVASTPTRLTVLLQARKSDEFVHSMLAVGSAAPHTIVGFLLMRAERPPEFALPHLTQAQLVSAAASYAQKQAANGEFSGTVLVAKNGTPIFQRAYGLADRAKNVPNTLDTKFRIGSMNKMFTATAIMQLVQAGKINLDKPLGTYVTDYPNKAVSSRVTIRELLTHTGGTGDIFGPEFAKNRLKLRTLQDYVNLYGKRPLRFKPGSKFEYSNYGFILLGTVIERVSGQSYYRYVRNHIYGPAGMTSTGSEPEDVAVANRSIGYMTDPDGKMQPNTDALPYRGTSAGGGYSTAGDLLRFANALLSHRLVDARYTQMMTTGTVEMVPGFKYGFGFGDRVVNGTRCFGHNGGAPGMNGDLEICDSGYVVAVLSNLDPPAAGRIADFIENRLPSKYLQGPGAKGSAQMTAFTSSDSFDKVYQFYHSKMPAGSEKMKADSGDSSVAEFVTGSDKPGEVQTMVMISKKGDKTAIVVTKGTNEK